MKVVFMGTPDFAVSTLEAILAAGHEVAAVVTQPDKPKGRGGAVTVSPVKETACRHGLTVLQPQRARDAEFIELLRSYAPDVIVVVAFGQILPKEILHMAPYGCINVHASLLPQYRGASPIQWAVIDGCEYSGVTTMLMDEGVDTGDILMAERVKLNEKETGGSLFERLSDVGAQLLVKTLEAAQQKTLTPVKQDDSASSYVKMLNKSFGEMDFTKTAAELERLIRGLNPWPSAFTYIHGKLLKIWDADVCDSAGSPQMPGTVIQVDAKHFTIQCAAGCLLVKEVQLEGKKRMRTEDFLRGYHIEVNTVLGKGEE